MNEWQLVNALREAADSLGLNLWAVARRLEEPERDVAPAFSGGEGFTVELLLRVAHELGLEVELRPALPRLRPVGPVPSVVDQAIQRVTPHLVEQPRAVADPRLGAAPCDQQSKTDPTEDAK